MRKKDAGEPQQNQKSGRANAKASVALEARYVAVSNVSNAKERLARAIAILLKVTIEDNCDGR